MDSKIVNKAIKKTIWSFLKEQGFSNFTTRNAWRFNQDRVEVVNFQSFNSYLAESLGCTTYSFGVNLGIYFIDIPNEIPNNPIKEKDGCILPEEYRCHFRKNLYKSLNQKEFNRQDIWFIDSSGNNIDLAMNDVKEMLISDGFKWFEKYSNMDEVLKTLLNDVEEVNGTWGFGRKDSPSRNYISGYIAYFLKEYGLAFQLLEKARNSGCFKNLDESLLRDCQCIKDKISY